MDSVPKPDRRVLIADAAIKVLAESGARGLTHLAIDKQLGLASGSTSYYFRTRAALLEATALRMVEVDTQDATHRLAKYAGTAESVAEGLGRLVAAYSRGEGRKRTIARYELFLLGTRDPSLGKMLEDFRAGFVQYGASLIPDVDSAKALTMAAATVALVEGFLFVNIRAPKPVWTQAQVREAVVALINAQLASL